MNGSAPPRPTYPLADTVRGLSALAVLTGHAILGNPLIGPTTARYTVQFEVAVWVFFTLSAFLLFLPFVQAWKTGVRVAVRDFYRRRAARILPAYWVALTAFWVYPGVPGVDERPWVFYGLLQSFKRTTSDLECAGGCGLGVAWSLSVELVFYLVLPLLAWVVIRLLTTAGSRPLRPAALGLLALGALSLWASTAPGMEDPGPIWNEIARMAAPRSFAAFVPGLLLALWVVLSPRWAAGGLPRQLLRARCAWPAALVVYLVLSVTLPPDTVAANLTVTELAVRGLGFAIFAGLAVAPAAAARPDRFDLLERVAATRPLRWFGDVSYGLYLWHLPILGVLSRHGLYSWTDHPNLLPPLILLAVTLPFAILSHHVVERPAIRWARRRTGRQGVRGPALDRPASAAGSGSP